MSEFFKKKRMLGRLQELSNKRAAHLSDWQKIASVIRPERGKFLDTASESSKRPTSMINSTPAVASRTLQAGMISGASSPAYQWFKLEYEDTEMMKFGPARRALEARELILSTALARSNFYQNLQAIYGDSADFGTGQGTIEKHPRDYFSIKGFAPGEYMIDVDEHGDVDTIYTELFWTPVQMISRFGIERVGEKVREAYDRGNYNTPFRVVMVIEPNQDIDESRADWRGKPWVKLFFEKDNKDDGEANYLELGGYTDWPGFGLRWDIATGNVWGQGCGLLALGDAAALQTLEFRDAQAVEKAVKPPLRAPIYLKNQPISHVPGGVTYFDPYGANAANVEPMYTIAPGILQALEAKIMNKELRINEVYFKDLFLMLATTDRREITAREVEEKHQEKLLALGPVLQRTHRDALNNAIARIYAILDEAGAFPPAANDLKGRKITVKYTSALAYAQRAAGAASLERFFGFTGQLAGVYPQVKHKVDAMKGMDYYADAIGVPAEIMVDDKSARQSMAAETQAAMAQQQAATLKDAASGAELLSRTDTSRPSALQFLMQRSGVA